MSTQMRPITLTSFGFRHATPPSPWVIDVREILNDPLDPGMRHMTGLDHEIRTHIASPAFLRITREITDMAVYMATPRRAPGIIPGADAFPAVHLSVGCSGGRHRSVAVAEAVAEMLGTEHHDDAPQVTVIHRDINEAVLPPTPA